MFDASISFLRVRDLGATAAFYEGMLGLELVLDQGRCRIYRASADGYLGFCQGQTGQSDTSRVILTLVSDDVDDWHRKLADRGVTFEKPPVFNEAFNIYHCLFRDPDGYLLEIQRFEDPAWPRKS
ncbi:MAG: VOC family protein [Gammaproteobacteria bacterium]|nr:VOC family protein [Gammaproteobacteria bacterium]